MGFFASINGNIAPAEEARVSVLDNGFTFGDGLYETLRTYKGRPFALDQHLTRLRASAARVGIAIPNTDPQLRDDLAALLQRAANEESFIRIIVTRGVGDISYNFERVQGPTVVMVAKPFVPYPESHFTEGIAVVVVAVQRNAREALDPAIKSCNLLNNILAMREAQARGAFEPLLLNPLGKLAEGASSNLFIVRQGTLLTPPLAAGILEGITRAIALELAREAQVPVREQDLSVEDLRTADEAFVTSSLKELTPVRTVDKRSIADGRPGAITRDLLARYRKRAWGESKQ